MLAGLDFRSPHLGNRQPLFADSALPGAPSAHGSLEIRFHDVLLHHALRVEEGTVERNAMTHDVDEAIALRLVQRDHHVFEFLVKRRRVAGGAVGIGRRFLAPLADGPAGFAFNPAFDPPAVEK